MDGLLEDVQALVHLRLAHDERRHKAQRVAMARRQQQHAALEARARDGGRERAAQPVVGGRARHKLGSDHQPAPAHVAQQRRIAERGIDGAQAFLELRAARGGVLEDALLLEDVERRHRRRARDRVAAVRAAARVGRLRRRDLAPGKDGRERVAAREALGGDEDVGRDLVMVDGPHPTCAPEAALHLVRDEQDAARGRPLAQPWQEAVGRHHVAPFTQHGLDEHGRDVARGRLLQQRRIERPERLVRADASVLVGVGHEGLA
mmetsp:Transcript_47181/g.124343  ORF Transcript_47181/g.124343 Transcript_47181/m.124343 type:complete len:262 (+) Transcript_47181:395-1180(+)